jgi:hypothetical protein
MSLQPFWLRLTMYRQLHLGEQARVPGPVLELPAVSVPEAQRMVARELTLPVQVLQHLLSRFLSREALPAELYRTSPQISLRTLCHSHQ